MPSLLHQLLDNGSTENPDAEALVYKDSSLTFSELSTLVSSVACSLLNLGLNSQERVAVYLPKIPETVSSIFGAAKAGGVFVPINPLLKPAQVGYILKDCNVRVLITASSRLTPLGDILSECHDLRSVVVVDDQVALPNVESLPQILPWGHFIEGGSGTPNTCFHSVVESDMAAILYTSGSTGRPKGVVLSHRNMVAGAESVSQYLRNRAGDRLLAVLPFSFDYGLSQLTTAFHVGASVALMDYLLPRDVVRAVVRHGITGLAAVPPLWNQLAQLDWPDEAVQSLRYITNSGGAMPKATTARLRNSLPNTQIYLMYGLTEAFRSTYLPPDEVAIRPDSIGKAIPNSEVLVVREDGAECAPGEPGELVHRGPLVALGYWNDPAKTAERFKPTPYRPTEIPIPEIAVWSGDQVRKDEDGFLYFISRNDEMIKTSGYRVSPTEIEEVLYGSGLVDEAAAFGIPHPTIGQAILVVVTPVTTDTVDKESVLNHCRKQLPNYMVPHEVIFQDTLPRNQNGKIDRKELANRFQDVPTES